MAEVEFGAEFNGTLAEKHEEWMVQCVWDMASGAEEWKNVDGGRRQSKDQKQQALEAQIEMHFGGKRGRAAADPPPPSYFCRFCTLKKWCMEKQCGDLAGSPLNVYQPPKG